MYNTCCRSYINDYLCEKQLMLRERKIQTAFRLDPNLLLRAKRQARRQEISLNRLVERAVESYLGDAGTPSRAAVEPIPDWVVELSDGARAFSQQELEADDRLAYLLAK